MSSSSSRAVSMMIGTVLVRPQPLADLEPVEPRQHHVEHDEVDRLLREAAQRLLAVAPPGRPCTRPSRAGTRAPCERRPRRRRAGSWGVDSGIGGRACCQDSPRDGGAPHPRTASPAAARLARASGQRRASTAAPCSSLSLPLLLARVQHRAPGAAPAAAPAARLRRRRDAARSRPTSRPHYPGPRARGAGRRRGRPVVPRPAGAVRPAGLQRRLGADDPGPRPRARSRTSWAVARGQSPDAIVVMAHRDDTGDGPGRERQRVAARPRSSSSRAATPTHGTPARARALGAHDRLPLDRRRSRRRARRAPLRRSPAVAASSRRSTSTRSPGPARRGS